MSLKVAALRFRGAVFLLFLVTVTAASRGVAGPPVPPVPSRYVTDNTGVLSKETLDALEAKLREFEDSSSNQVLVYLESRVPEGTTLEEYTVATAQAWRAGQKEKKNGVVLFVFPADKAARIEVGYGLEGALPDATSNQILSERVIPRFKESDWNGGVSAGVDAIVAATKGEYTGTGPRRSPQQARRRGGGIPWPFILFLVFVIIPMLRRRRPYFFIGGGGFGSGGGFGGGGGGFGGFGGGGGDGGGFSGGGGSFGGGGASGRW